MHDGETDPPPLTPSLRKASDAMAGDWIKMEASTPDKAEVLAITATMGWDDVDITVGKLFRVWRWFDQQTVNGNAPGVTSALLDRVAGVSGFAEAMQKVGWLTIKSSGITLPNFDRHNGKTAKARALTGRRVKDFKGRTDKSNDEVTQAALPSALPREEKRRRESKTLRPRRKPPSDTPPRFADDSTEMKAARYLFEKMRANNAGAKEPNWQAWAREIDLTLRVDYRDKDELRRVIDWCQSDPFWRTNVLSPATLRKQYERLVMAMKQPQKATPQRKGPAPHPDAPHLPPFTN